MARRALFWAWLVTWIAAFHGVSAGLFGPTGYHVRDRTMATTKKVAREITPKVTVPPLIEPSSAAVRSTMTTSKRAISKTFGVIGPAYESLRTRTRGALESAEIAAQQVYDNNRLKFRQTDLSRWFQLRKPVGLDIAQLYYAMTWGRERVRWPIAIDDDWRRGHFASLMAMRYKLNRVLDSVRMLHHEKIQKPSHIEERLAAYNRLTYQTEIMMQLTLLVAESQPPLGARQAYGATLDWPQYVESLMWATHIDSIGVWLRQLDRIRAFAKSATATLNEYKEWNGDVATHPRWSDFPIPTNKIQVLSTIPYQDGADDTLNVAFANDARQTQHYIGHEDRARAARIRVEGDPDLWPSWFNEEVRRVRAMFQSPSQSRPRTVLKPDGLLPVACEKIYSSRLASASKRAVPTTNCFKLMKENIYWKAPSDVAIALAAETPDRSLALIEDADRSFYPKNTRLWRYGLIRRSETEWHTLSPNLANVMEAHRTWMAQYMEFTHMTPSLGSWSPDARDDCDNEALNYMIKDSLWLSDFPFQLMTASLGNCFVKDTPDDAQAVAMELLTVLLAEAEHTWRYLVEQAHSLILPPEKNDSRSKKDNYYRTWALTLLFATSITEKFGHSTRQILMILRALSLPNWVTAWTRLAQKVSVLQDGLLDQAHIEYATRQKKNAEMRRQSPERLEKLLREPVLPEPLAMFSSAMIAWVTIHGGPAAHIMPVNAQHYFAIRAGHLNRMDGRSKSAPPGGLRRFNAQKVLRSSRRTGR
ncbi:hypothetical protein CXG81DRAFT_16890 [Caulochytrium protostelioides]|uniref:Alginate lyase domain-containing protein n=1 Tax=Caulochytrium protostelioides TaxID=1555241 RepID=A0A4V1IVD3_9FUNG|nr:hypothetical protein CXG81DRAFT_16890 [Caulochytrium protostelioides]|eukprot:RKP03659.1 hypothetical protein CXG81DRAFT_16890 [Caulochytrium protostelioides]